MRYTFFSILIISFLLSACKGNADKSVQFEIQTNYGDFVVELYDNTPKHKSNFMVLANKGYYDGLLFHRIVEDFMIQGGDPDSRDASSKKLLGAGGPDYTIKAEIHPKNIHKRGALAAARKGDLSNPDKRSSGSQFYIVTGKKYTQAELDALEDRITNARRKALMNAYIDNRAGLREKIDNYQQEGNYEAVDEILSEVANTIKRDSIGFKPFSISEERRKVYTTAGGVPTLDDEYTVFGEVIEGMDVVEKISQLPVDANDRPLYDVKMTVKPRR